MSLDSLCVPGMLVHVRESEALLWRSLSKSDFGAQRVSGPLTVIGRSPAFHAVLVVSHLGIGWINLNNVVR